MGADGIEETIERRPVARAPADPALRLFDAIRRDARATLSGLLDGLFEHVRDQARETWLASPDSRARQVDRDTAGDLASARAGFRDSWCERIDAAFEAWRDAPGEPVHSAREALSLVSDSQLLLQLEAQALADWFTAETGAAWEALAARLDQFVHGLGGRRHGPCPLDPVLVGDGFVAGFAGQDIGSGLRELLMSEFRRRLRPALDGLHARTGRALAQSGINEAAASPAPPPRKPAPPPASASVQGGWVPDGGMVEALPPARSEGAPPLPGIDPSGQFGVPAGGSGIGVGGGPMAAPPPPREQGMPLRYRDIVHEHLLQWRTGAGAGFSSAMAGDTALGTQALCTVASLLQGDDAGRFSRLMACDDSRHLSGAIRDAVASGAQQLGLSAGPLRYAPDEEDAIDLVAMLFAALVRTSSAGNRTALPRLYGRLVMPYLKVALQDDSLFNRRAHPARQLLDVLSEVCGEADRERESVDFAEGVVERLVAGYREDLAIFGLATEELRQYQQQQRRRAEIAERRTAEALYGRERLEQARGQAHARLCEWFGRQPLSEAAAMFLRGPWRHGFEQACLREAAEPGRRDELLALGERLLRLDADAMRVDGPAIAAGWLEIAPALEACCLRAGFDPDAAEACLAGLVFAFAHPRTERVRHDPGEPPGDVADFGRLRLVGGVDTVEHDPALAARMRRLRAGQALRMTEEDGSESLGRVAWISPLTGRLLVVNRRGQRQLVVSPEQLAALIGEGRIALRASEAPVDQAMKLVWQQLSSARGEVDG